MPVESYRELIVWQKSMKLAKAVYRLALLLPKDEIFGLSAQIKRCSVSIPSNIAEGSRRGTAKDYRQFLYIAFGSGPNWKLNWNFAGSSSTFVRMHFPRLLDYWKKS